MLPWFLSPSARLDLLSHWDYFTQTAGDEELANRFARQARLSFQTIARKPGLGRLVFSGHPTLSEIRQWRVDGFPNLLIFYRETSGEVEIARVIHGARNLDVVLGGSDGIEE